MSQTTRGKTRGTGLLMVWTDIDAEFEAEFNRWYDEEHIARLLEVPGFLSAGRYMAVRGGPKYLAMYELEDHNVLRSAAYLDTVQYQPSPQRTKIGTSRVGRNFLRNAYRQIFPVHTNPIEQTVAMAPFLQMGRIDVSVAIEEEFNAWYNTAYIPGYLAVPGCLGARRFVAVEGQPKYLTVYEFEHARISESEAWIRAGCNRNCAMTKVRSESTSASIRNSRPAATFPGRKRMKIDGHCHCGAITFEAEVDPNALTICHCTDCQTLTGSAFRVNIPAPAEHFVLRGTPKTYVKTAESGNKRLHAFCGNCGTPIYASAVDNPHVYALRAGTITQRAAFKPQRQGLRRSALNWVDSLAAVPAAEKGWS